MENNKIVSTRQQIYYPTDSIGLAQILFNRRRISKNDFMVIKFKKVKSTSYKPLMAKLNLFRKEIAKNNRFKEQMHNIKPQSKRTKINTPRGIYSIPLTKIASKNIINDVFIFEGIDRLIDHQVEQEGQQEIETKLSLHNNY